MATIQDNSTILIYKVGPVLCCAPCLSVISITHPAPLTKLPGQKARHSGIFKFGTNLVNVCELRKNFGVVPEQWRDPGRIIITQLSSGHVGFWVDDIIDVMESPSTGWGNPPPLIPKATFSKTLTLNNEIHLYAEFENLYAIKQVGYLKSYIEHLNKLKNNEDKISKDSKETTTSENNPESKKIIIQDTISVNTKTETMNSKNSSSINITDTSAIEKLQQSDFNKTILKQQEISDTDSSSSSSSSSSSNILNTKTEDAKHISKNNINKKSVNSSSDIKPTKNVNTNSVRIVNHSTKEQNIIPKISNNIKVKKTERTIIYNTDKSEQSLIGLFIGVVLLFSFLIGGIFYSLYETEESEMKYISNEIKSDVNPKKQLTKKVSSNTNKSTGEISKHTNINSYIENHESINLKEIKNISNKKPTLTKPNTDDSNTEKYSENLNHIDSNQKNNTSHYSAKITNDENEITITVHTPITNEKFRSLKKESDKITNTKKNKITENRKISMNESEEKINKSDDITINIQSSINQNNSKIAPSTITKKIIHIVVKGDTLWHIAKFYVDDPYQYPELARLSNIKNPDLIYPGNRVHIIQIFTNGIDENE